MIVVMRAQSVRFSAVARSVADEARRMGLTVPVFRSPPGLDDEDRTIRRSAGTWVVAVRLRGRPFADVVADVIDGVVVVNRIGRRDDLGVRRRLLRAVEAEVYDAA